MYSVPFLLMKPAGAACSVLGGIYKGVHPVALLEPTCVSSPSNSPIVLAAASSDTLYQITNNINSLIQQQLSGRDLHPVRHGAFLATRIFSELLFSVRWNQFRALLPCSSKPSPVQANPATKTKDEVFHTVRNRCFPGNICHHIRGRALDQSVAVHLECAPSHAGIHWWLCQ